MFKEVRLKEQSRRVKWYNGMEKPSNLFSPSSEGLSGPVCSANPCSNCDMLTSAKGSSYELGKRLSAGWPRLLEAPKVKSSALKYRQNGCRLSSNQRDPLTSYMFPSRSWTNDLACPTPRSTGGSRYAVGTLRALGRPGRTSPWYRSHPWCPLDGGLRRSYVGAGVGKGFLSHESSCRLKQRVEQVSNRSVPAKSAVVYSTPSRLCQPAFRPSQ